MSIELLLFIIPVLIFSIIVHEVAHGYAALFLGDRTAQNAGRLTINPISHIDPIGSILLPVLTSFTGFFFGYAKPVPYNPNNLNNKKWGEAIVAFAGPASNILIALFFAGVVQTGLLNAAPEIVVTGMFFIIFANLFLALLNLIPVAPLDGSKILFALLPYKWVGFRRWMEQYQIFLLIALIIFLINVPFLGSAVMNISILLVS